jgi:hypothetical protein
LGYDITFHPVALSELQRFVFDVIDDRRRLEGRLGELSRDPEQRATLADLFGRVFRAIDLEEAFAARGPGPADDELDDEDAEEDDDDIGPAASEVRFLAAAVAGCLHPYWYSRGGGLTFVRDSEVRRWIRPYHEIGQGKVRSIVDDSPFIDGNVSANGFIPPESVVVLEERLRTPAQPYVDGLGEEGLDALRRAVAYARERALGLIEATDIVVPGGGMFVTAPDHLRAGHLGNLDAPAPSPAAPTAPRTCPKCGLLNPPEVQRCDCGQHLAASSGFAAYEHPEGSASRGGRFLVWAIIVVLAWTLVRSCL